MIKEARYNSQSANHNNRTSVHEIASSVPTLPVGLL